MPSLRSHLCIPQASERRLRPLPQKQRTLHEKILEEIRQERKLRPVEQKGTSVPSPLGCVTCVPIPTALSLSLRRVQLLALHPTRLCWPPELQLLPRAVPVPGQRRARAPAATRPAQGAHPGRDGGDEPLRGKGEPAGVGTHGGCRGALGDTVPVALQDEDSPATEVPLKRDRSFSEQDLAQLQSQLGGDQAVPQDPEPLQPELRPRSGAARDPCPQGVCATPFRGGGTGERVLGTASLSLPAGSVPASCHRLPDGPALPRAALGAVEERPEDGSSAAPSSSSKHLWLVGSGDTGAGDIMQA